MDAVEIDDVKDVKDKDNNVVNVQNEVREADNCKEMAENLNVLLSVVVDPVQQDVKVSIQNFLLQKVEKDVKVFVTDM